MKEAGTTACCVLLALSFCAIFELGQAEPGPGFNGVSSSENSAQLDVEEFVNDPVLARLIDQALVGNQELKALTQDVKDDADEPLSKIVELTASEARACESDRLLRAAHPAVLRNLRPPAG